MEPKSLTNDGWPNKTHEIPKWAKAAFARAGEDRYCEVNKVRVHYLFWKAKDFGFTTPAPSLLLIHGTTAHAHWFDHMAPFFVDIGFDVVALDLAGFGDSQTREELNVEKWSQDVFSVSQQEGFLRADRPSKPVLVGHSLGAYVCIGTAIRHRNSYAGLVLLDAALPHPFSFGDEDTVSQIAQVRERVARRPHRSHSVGVKPTERFRLMPPQQVRQPFLHEHIANHSVVLAADGKTWKWKFDNNHMVKLNFDAVVTLGRPKTVRALLSTGIKMAVIYGAESAICNPLVVEYAKAHHGDVTFVAIPDAEHHVFLDQPVAVIAALRSFLGEWRLMRSGSATHHDLPQDGEQQLKDIAQTTMQNRLVAIKKYEAMRSKL